MHVIITLALPIPPTTKTVLPAKIPRMQKMAHNTNTHTHDNQTIYDIKSLECRRIHEFVATENYTSVTNHQIIYEYKIFVKAYRFIITIWTLRYG